MTWVAASDDLQSATLLIAHGADLNLCDEEGWSALHYAVVSVEASGVNNACLALLVRAGANFESIKDDYPSDYTECLAIREAQELKRAVTGARRSESPGL